MTRLGLYATGAAIGLTMIAAVVVYVTSAERAKRELDDAKTHIETRERIDDAIAPVDGCFWLDRLRASCP